MIELTGYRDKHEYTNKHGVKSVVYLMDCMDAMEQMGDKEFGLAVVDPPFGLGDKLTQGGTWANKYKKGDADWDKAPNQNYFDSLFRVS